jgi:glycerol-3-phosphate acyltransferase PlsX
MGGDFAPASTVAGAIEALKHYADIEIIFVGDTTRIEKELAEIAVPPAFAKRYSIRHASQVVEMGDSAIDAVRRKKDSSISRACDLIADGEAEAIVSAGHTGALVAAAKIKLRSSSTRARMSIPTRTICSSSASWARSIPAKCWAGKTRASA